MPEFFRMTMYIKVSEFMRNKMIHMSALIATNRPHLEDYMILIIIAPTISLTSIHYRNLNIRKSNAARYLVCSLLIYIQSLPFYFC